MRCAQVIAAPVYLGRDNVIELVVIADGAVLADLSGVTRVTLDLDGGTTVIDSGTAPTAIWWTDQATHRGALVDVVTLRLGQQAIPTATYEDVALVLFDSTYPNGLRLESALKLTVQ